MSERPEFYSSRPIADPITILVQPVSLFGLVEFTMVQMHFSCLRRGSLTRKAVTFRLMRLSITARFPD